MYDEKEIQNTVYSLIFLYLNYTGMQDMQIKQSVIYICVCAYVILKKYEGAWRIKFYSDI